MPELKSEKKIYFIGIKGTALSALAVICKQMGMNVTGSDVKEEFITDAILKEEGIEFFEGFDVKNTECNPDLVVVGTSFGKDNVEVIEFQKNGVEMITDSQCRGLLSKMKKTVSVAGVHGKTTTTALLAYIFKEAGRSPSWLVGTGHVFGLGSNGHWGQGSRFIVEADEYVKSFEDCEPKFLDLQSHTSIITSLEWEHVDVYENEEVLEKHFKKFIEQTHHKVIACTDWERVRKIIVGQEKKVVTYGQKEDAIWHVYNFSEYSFSVKYKGEFFYDFTMKLVGSHNAVNATACIAVASLAGIDRKTIARAIDSFEGLERRFEVEEKNGIIFVDDYGHHPTEIEKTLKAARQKFGDKKIWCVFQPHMASRTEKLLEQFQKVFDSADKVGIVDIFESAREHGHKITSQDLVEEVRAHNSNVSYYGSLSQAAERIKGLVKPGDVLMTMGAGDVYKIRDTIIDS